MNRNMQYTDHYKEIGLLPVSEVSLQEINSPDYISYIKILYLPQGYELTVDFTDYRTRKPALFFVNSNQHMHIHKAGKEQGHFMYYNRDFYCIQIHDAEVACDGLLFNNVYQVPVTELSPKENTLVLNLYEQIREEFEEEASAKEEMLRIYLKQIIIRATRLWKQQQLGKLNHEPLPEIEFFRDFSRLVEIHFRTRHTVADYAELLSVAPKTLSNKFKRFNLPQPNEVIKNRIMLEAKRLLNYTDLSVKEIAYDLGYEDPAYFNRLFTGKVGDSPAVFKKKYLQGKNVQSE
ncbi:helix-turn-helix domain-containing protein [Sinomicrobium weinanense]|uniref:Helix-turn-helix domain-containing protein n=1 Tax=Sinomicrobium weinanense TaxID=2842200 RepID=A0A926JPI2_9FLAO|nr:helix-turn-helix domain-containing protein [Sinomicrobium weinanense]MBC9794989.1 helix-turn-helix domain-containing protein [Sinomicrobium weinanense]MBU3125150.1 helix-turn-helix domain-containing protein [Sinomicrobium weinanense]